MDKLIRNKKFINAITLLEGIIIFSMTLLIMLEEKLGINNNSLHIIQIISIIILIAIFIILLMNYSYRQTEEGKKELFIRQNDERHKEIALKSIKYSFLTMLFSLLIFGYTIGYFYNEEIIGAIIVSFCFLIIILSFVFKMIFERKM